MVEVTAQSRALVFVAGRTVAIAMAIALATIVLTPQHAEATVSSSVQPIVDAPPVDSYGGRAPGVCKSPRPGVKSFQKLLQSVYPNRNSSMSRACPSSTFSDRLSNHYKGLALDWFLNAETSSGRREARQIFDWLFAPSNDGTERHVRLRRLGITEIIWDNKIWLASTAQYSSYASHNATGDWNTWENYSTYRSCGKTDRNCRHENHIHFSFSVEGGDRTTTWWTDLFAPYRDKPKQTPRALAVPQFGIHSNLRRSDLSLWLYRLADGPAQTGAYSSPGHERAWEWHDSHGINALGASGNLDASVSRQAFAEILYEFDGLDGQRREVNPALTGITFADVDESHTSIYWLAHTGSATDFRTSGGLTYFDPGQTITKGDAIRFLHRWAGQPAVVTPPRHVYTELPALTGSHPDVKYRSALLWAWVGGVATDTFGDVPMYHSFYGEVNWLVDEGATTGYAPDWWEAIQTFRPTEPVTRQAMAAFVYRLSGETYQPAWGQQTFPDVNVGHPFYVEIEWLASTGATTGYGDGSFRPQAFVTRQAMAAFLHRLAGEPAFPDVDEPQFSDVQTDHPFFAHINWLAESGITTGYGDGSFGSNRDVTRQAMATFLFRLFEEYLAEAQGQPGTAVPDDPAVDQVPAGDEPTPEPSPSPEPSPVASPSPSPSPSPSVG